MTHDCIEISFDDQGVALLTDIILAEVDSIEGLAFFEYSGLRRINILWQGVIHNPASKSHDVVPHVAYREENTPPEPVPASFPVSDSQAGIHQDGVGVAHFLQMEGKGISLIRRVAYGECGECVFADASLPEIRHRSI